MSTPGPLGPLDAWLDTVVWSTVTRRTIIWGVLGASISVGFVLMLLITWK